MCRIAASDDYIPLKDTGYCSLTLERMHSRNGTCFLVKAVWKRILFADKAFEDVPRIFHGKSNEIPQFLIFPFGFLRKENFKS